MRSITIRKIPTAKAFLILYSRQFLLELLRSRSDNLNFKYEAKCEYHTISSTTGRGGPGPCSFSSKAR